MPAEWDRHEATWLAWPHNPEDWPGKFQAIPWLYAEIVRLLAGHERVHLIVQNGKEESRARGILRRSGANLDQVSFHQWPTDRVWMRDSGPIFVRNVEGQVAITDWRFNAWAKSLDWHRDDQIRSRKTAERSRLATGDPAQGWLGTAPWFSRAAQSIRMAKAFC
jgi:agmatine deiminase